MCCTLPFALMIWMMFGLNAAPQRAALYATAALFALWLVFGFKGRRPTLASVREILEETGSSLLSLVVIAAAAGIIIGVMNVSSLGFALSLALVKFAGGNLLLLLLLAALLCIVLGMGLPTVGVYILLATLVAPALADLGVPVLSAHLFVLYFGMMSMITPPVAIAAFAGATIARSAPIPTAFEAMKLSWAAYIVPFLFVFSPELLLQGAFGTIALAVATALLGVWLVSTAVIGYARFRLGLFGRVALGLSGLGLLIPHSAFAYAGHLNIAGAVLALACLAGMYLVPAMFEKPAGRPT